MGLDLDFMRAATAHVSADSVEHLAATQGHPHLAPLGTQADTIHVRTAEQVGYWRDEWTLYGLVIQLHNDNRDDELSPSDLNSVQMLMDYDQVKNLLTIIQAAESRDSIREANGWDDTFFTYTTQVLTTALDELATQPSDVTYYFYGWW